MNKLDFQLGSYDVSGLDGVASTLSSWSPITDMTALQAKWGIDLSYHLYNLGFTKFDTDTNTQFGGSEGASDSDAGPTRANPGFDTPSSNTDPAPANLTQIQNYVKQQVESAFPNDPTAWTSTYNIVEHESGWSNVGVDSVQRNAIKNSANYNTGYFQQSELDAKRYGFPKQPLYTMSYQQQTAFYLAYIKGGYGSPTAAWNQWPAAHNKRGVNSY